MLLLLKRAIAAFSRPRTFAIAMCVACTLPAGTSIPSDTESDTDTDTDADSDTDTDTDTDDTDTDTDTDDTDTDPGPVFDCSALPAAPLSISDVQGARGYHGLVIDENGLMYGNDTSNLVQADAFGAASVFKPGVGTLEQMAWVPGGDLAASSLWDNQLLRITPQGGISIISNGNYYGVLLGPDDMLYASDFLSDRVDRIDPATGQRTTLLDLNWTPHAMAFSLDNTKLYIGAAYEQNLYEVDLDANYDPVGPPTVFVAGLGDNPGYMDAIVVDICGNLYLSEFFSANIYRISPNGSVELYVNANQTHYAHALVWGTGENGWDDMSMYAGQPYNNEGVQRIEVGVPSRDWEGIAINLP